MRLYRYLYTSIRNNRFDITVFGGSGFTGKYIIEELSRVANGSTIRWAIAGRDNNKLQNVIKQISQKTSRDLHSIPIITADINDPKSLIEMCEKSNIVINCVGPYRFYGEDVVKCCINSGTHHIDVAGEPQYMETVQLNYDELAKEKRVHVISSCGWDSVPCDIGVQYLKKNFNGTLNSTETFLSLNSGSKGAKGNITTWDALINGYAHRKELRELRKQLFSTIFKPYHRTKYQIKRKSIFWDKLANGWSVPFPGSDRSVVNRSQLYFYTHYNERPTQIETYFVIDKFGGVIKVALSGILFNTFSMFSYTRSVMKKYPRLFSGGIFDNNSAPSYDELLKSSFSLLIVGKGWNEVYSDPTFVPSKNPDKTMIVRVSGGEPAYLGASTIVVQTAITLLEEGKNLQNVYGVLTPAVAFANTSLIERLCDNGIRFEILSD